MSESKTDAVMAYYFTDHICRVCFGRVMTRVTFDRRRLYCCADCGVELEGKSEAAVCCCGIKLKNGRDAGIRCRSNDERSPESPFVIIAEQAEVS
ncbi:hypothetical protein [Paraburkholderia phenoliruptrix]|uniref:hypothetical protein n=1 Tax=Paraburkholderia phenoliruptrix TaxID=252970 RepID=UPI0034CD37B4